jgi:Zn finger protein HypA/HybF involved in hydrogenase expression
MHEVSLVAELVELCVRRAEQARTPVAAVRIRYATTIPEDGLRQAFEMLTKETPLAGAALEAQPFDRVLDCQRCGFHGALGHDDVVGATAVCPRCDDVTALPPTPELELLELVS